MGPTKAIATPDGEALMKYFTFSLKRRTNICRGNVSQWCPTLAIVRTTLRCNVLLKNSGEPDTVLLGDSVSAKSAGVEKRDQDCDIADFNRFEMKFI